MKWAVFVSGNGSNLQNFLDLEKNGKFQFQRVGGVVADKRCPAIERAQKAGKPTLVLSPKNPEFVAETMRFLHAHQIEAIFLLGYLRILSADFLKAWSKKIINLHPSWLPKYPGLHSIEEAFQAGEAFMGVTLHEVVEALDAGPIVRQISFPRDERLTLEELIEKVHEVERKLVADYLLDLDSHERALVSKH